MTISWNCASPPDLASPTLAVLCGPDGVWAGGFGGVAWFPEGGTWTLLTSGLPLGSVAALASSGGILLAGGVGGIARSTDYGRTWQRCSVPAGTRPVTAITLSPSFGRDGTALAATLDNGILRSNDCGQSWLPSSFGLLSREALALTWVRDESVVVATSSGLARSSNAGRSWRPVSQTAGTAFVAVATLANGEILAAPESGPLLRSTDDLATWSTIGDRSSDAHTSVLASAVGSDVLLKSDEYGISRSTDGGERWSVVSAIRALCFAADETVIYAGTSVGVQVSTDGGRTWAALPTPPLHDLRRLLIVDRRVVIAGSNSPPVGREPDGGWVALTGAPLPLSGLTVAPDGAIVGAAPDGLYRSGDTGASWERVMGGPMSTVTHLTFLPDGNGWAGLTPDSALLRTGDGGRTWEKLPPPFGVLPLVALQAVPASPSRPSASLIAATYDDRRKMVAIWRSDDGGRRWQRGGDIATPWPAVATSDSPPLVTFGNVITIQHADGTWRRATLGEEGLRRVVSEGATLIALAVDGIWRSRDLGATWERFEADLPVDQIADIGIVSGELHVLLSGGRLWSRPLSTVQAAEQGDLALSAPA